MGVGGRRILCLSPPKDIEGQTHARTYNDTMATMSENERTEKIFHTQKEKVEKKKKHTETSRRAGDAVWLVPTLLPTISNKLEWRD